VILDIEVIDRAIAYLRLNSRQISESATTFLGGFAFRHAPNR
jgi:hypothetical protein